MNEHTCTLIKYSAQLNCGRIKGTEELVLIGTVCYWNCAYIKLHWGEPHTRVEAFASVLPCTGKRTNDVLAPC